jgi:hypothetical protein
MAPCAFKIPVTRLAGAFRFARLVRTRSCRVLLVPWLDARRVYSVSAMPQPYFNSSIQMFPVVSEYS